MCWCQQKVATRSHLVRHCIIVLRGLCIRKRYRRKITLYKFDDGFLIEKVNLSQKFKLKIAPSICGSKRRQA